MELLRGETRGALGGGMSGPIKYAFVLALGLTFGYGLHAPWNLEEIAKLSLLDEINVIINEAVAAVKPHAVVFAADPAGAARVEEDLDYRIAERIGSIEGWRSFLAVHGSGVHVQTAKALVEKLLLAEKASEPGAANISSGASPDANAVGEPAPTAPPSANTEVATFTPDDICKRDGDRLEQLRSNPTSDEVARFANELRCETLRPQLLSLMAGLDQAPSAPAAAEVLNASPQAGVAGEPAPTAPPSANTEVATVTPDDICKRDGDRLEQLRSNPASDEVARFANELRCETLRPQLLSLMASLDHDAAVSAAAPPTRHASKVGSAEGPRSRTVASTNSTRSAASSRGFQPSRRVNHCAFRFACFSRSPPILMALLGERPKNSTAFLRTVVPAKPNASSNR
jgi:hypothetical protein